MNSVHTETYYNVKVLDKQQQQIIKNKTTEYRYIIITDKGTFIVVNNLIQGKFNNSDIFYRIKKDSVYKEVIVSGYGKSILFDYQNIIEIK